MATGLLDRVFPFHSKAVTGPGYVASSVYQPLWTGDAVYSYNRNPRRLMREAQSAYHTHPWIRACENLIGQRFSTVSWHLEDQEDNEIDDQTSGPLREIWNLIERPYTPIPGDPITNTPKTRSALWKITSRHMGLCNVAAWYLDQVEATGSTPTQILYLNPARLTPGQTPAGQLTHWILDADDQGNGTRLELTEVLLFQLDPPDTGWFGTGLVEAASQKTELTRLVDQHSANVLRQGGKQGGVISPKAGQLSDEQHEQLVRDVRVINEGPDAAKRWLILKGPVDYTRTSATPVELNLMEIAQMAKEDILAMWGVPGTQLGIAMPAGLNSGGTKDADFEVLWQNAVGPRLRSFRETLQFELLDRWKVFGLQPEVEIEEPQFDDKFPQFELAGQAANQPLRNVERRKLMGLDPFGDEALDNAIWMPTNVISVGQAPDEESGVIAPPPSLDEMRHQVAVSQPGSGLAPVAPAPFGKASLRDQTVESMKSDIAKVLKSFGSLAATKAAEKYDHLRRKPSEVQGLFDPEKFMSALEGALRPYGATIAADANTRASQRLHAGKARTANNVLSKLLSQIGLRVKGISETTREDLIRLVKQGMDDGLSAAQLGDLIGSSSTFNELRAETIARTETGTYLNLAAGQAYRDFGVEKVLVIDGETDDICVQANGQVWTMDELDGNPLGHPNCTRDFSPLLPGDVSA